VNTKIKILFVEHDSNDLELIEYELKRGEIKYISQLVQNESEYRNALANFVPDIILSDYSLPSFDGPTAFKIRQEIAPETPFIFVSGNIGEENSIEYIKSGVTDYALKDKLFTLAIKVRRAITESREKQQKNKIEKERLQGEFRLREAQTIAHLGSWEIDLVDNIHHWSDELFTIFGIQKEGELPSTELFFSFLHPDDLDFVIEKNKKAFETLADSSFDFRFIRKDGALRHGHSMYRFDFDVDRKHVRLSGIVQDITEKKLVDEALQATHERLLFHIENTPLGFMEWNNQLHAKSWSKRAEEIFGWTEKEYMESQMTVYDLVYKEDLPMMYKMEQQLVTGELTRNRVQYRNNTKDGRVIWCEWFNSASMDKNGRVITIMSLVQDITERKEAELQKEFDQNNLNSLINNTNDGMWSVDKNLQLITSNQAFDEMVKSMFGKLLLKGDNILAVGFSEDQLKRFKLFYQRALSGETFTEMEYNEFPVEFWSEISFHPSWKEGRVIGIACFSRDITLKRKEEDHLKLLESVITNATDSVLITEAKPLEGDGPRIVFVNDAFIKMTGYSREEVMGKTPRILQGPQSNRVELDRLRKSLEKSEACETEIINYRKNGEKFWINMEIAPVKDSKGFPTHFIAIERDVTERLKSMQAIKEQNIKLRDIAWMQSHEVRGPLARIMGLINLLNSYSLSQKADGTTELINHLNSSAIELDQVIKGIVRKTEEITE
jgi:PAS domain S-box-containing protein